MDTERQSFQQIRNQQVTGSSPVVGSIFKILKMRALDKCNKKIFLRFGKFTARIFAPDE